MFKVNNFKSITSKSGSPMVLCSAQTPDERLASLGVAGALTERIGFIRFADKASADAAVAVLSKLNVSLARVDGTDICNVVIL